MKLINTKTRLILVLSFFFLIRSGFAYFFGWKKILLSSDAEAYNGYALAILKSMEWLTNPDFLGHFREPIYPLFLSVIYLLFGIENLLAVFFFQALISTITAYYIFKLSACLFGEDESYLALFWSGFYLLYFYYIGMLYRETLIQFLIIFSFYHLWLFFVNKQVDHFLKNRNIWCFFLTFTILLHTDARFLFYIPFMLILFIIFSDFYTGVKNYLIMVGIFVLLLIPWSVRNYIAYDTFVLINTRTLDMSKKDITIRLEFFDTKDITAPGKAGISPNFISNEDYPSEEERILIKKGENPHKRPEYEINLIRNDKYPATSFIGRKLYFLANMWLPFKFWWDYYPFPDARLNKPWSLGHNLSSILFYGVLFPFVFWGSFYLFRKRQKSLWFLTFPIFCHLAMHFLLFGVERYRVQIDSFIVILGCYGLLLVINTIKYQNKLTRKYVY